MNKFSLVMPTLGRVREIEQLFISLINQTYKNFELIVVDQNHHNEVKNLCSQYEDQLDITYIKSKITGLSKNRNVGIAASTGNIIAFPDDDCEYSHDTLEKVNNFFIYNTFDIYACKVIDKHNKKPFGKSENQDSLITYNNVMKNCVSISVFIRYQNKEDIIFDEKLGVGTYFSSGEESDLIFSLLHNGYKGKYFCNQYIYHPYKENNNDRIIGDSLGLGALMKKEIVYRKNIGLVFFFLSRIIRPMIGIILKPHKINVYINSVKYRIRGFKEYKL